LVLISSI